MDFNTHYAVTSYEICTTLCSSGGCMSFYDKLSTVILHNGETVFCHPWNNRYITFKSPTYILLTSICGNTAFGVLKTNKEDGVITITFFHTDTECVSFVEKKNNYLKVRKIIL